MTTSFAIPPGHHFTCSRCGDCCRGWNVALGPGEAERLRALDWTGRSSTADLVDRDPVVTTRLPGGGSAERLARHDDGRCVFLGTHEQCRLHEHLGAAAKPLLCRLYPFGYYRLEPSPDFAAPANPGAGSGSGSSPSFGPGSRSDSGSGSGSSSNPGAGAPSPAAPRPPLPPAATIAVDVSWACRAVAGDRGAPLEAQLPAWTTLLAEIGADTGATLAPRSHWLAPGRPLPGPLLWEIEYHLLAFLDLRELPLFDRLRCGLQFLRLATTGDPTTAAARLLRQAIARGLPRQIAKIPHGGGMDRTQRAFFYSWLYLALNPVPANLDLVPERAAAHTARVAAGDRFRQRDGAPVIDGQPLPIDFAAVDRVDASHVAGHDVPVLRRYFQARLVGQRFLFSAAGERPVTEAVPALYLVYPMAIWTSRALAAARGATAVADEDLRAALRLLDRAVGQLTVAHAPRQLADAWAFTLIEGDLVTAAVDELLDTPAPPDVELGPS